MTPAQKELARHALGLSRRHKVAYRNHYVTGPSPEFDEWQKMVAAGEANHKAGGPISGGEDIFWLTSKGAQAALEKGESLDPHRWRRLSATS